MVDKAPGGVAFLDDGYYEEIVVGEEIVGETGAAEEEVITDHFVTEDGTLITSSGQPGHLDGNLLTITDEHHTIVTTAPAETSLLDEHQQGALTGTQQMIVRQPPPPVTQSQQQQLSQQSQVVPSLEEQNIVDPLPRPKHERCRCEARLYVHYHCAICSKPFAKSCMLRHFQHLHYAPGSVRTTYAHLIDEDRELYGVISYSQLTPNPAHVIKLANGSKRCSNSICKAKRREGAIEECEHCLAIDDGPPSAPEPIFIDQHILENCHKDFVDSYKQYCNSAAQHGVPAVCVLRAPPHVTSHIIYSCFNENNIQKRYLVVQYEPTISCSCGVGAEKACWHRAIVSLCCQAPGQSDNDSLDPPFQTLFSLREMQRFIENTTGAEGAGRDVSGRTPKQSGGRRSKMAKMAMTAGQDATPHFDPQATPGASLMGRDSSEIEHAQLLSELGGVGASGAVIQQGQVDPTQNVLASMSSVGTAAQQALMIPTSSVDAAGGIPTHPHSQPQLMGAAAGAAGSVDFMGTGAAGTPGAGYAYASAPEMLIAINRLNDTIESLKSEIVSLKSQVAESNKMGGGRLRDEGVYTISVNGPHASRSTLEHLSRKQAKVVLPSFDLDAKTSEISGSEAAVSSSSSAQGFTVTDSSNTKMSSSRQAGLTSSSVGVIDIDEFEEVSEDENDPNKAPGANVASSINSTVAATGGTDPNGRPRRQVQPNRLYSGKEFLVDTNSSMNTPSHRANNNNNPNTASSAINNTPIAPFKSKTN